MKIITEVGNLMDYPGDIAHGANCKGVMGAGVAKAVRERYPRVYNKYREAYYDGLLVPGTIFPVYHSDNLSAKWVFNLLTQFDPGSEAKYPYIQRSLEYMSTFARHYAIREVATVPLGCGIGGLKWKHVRNTIDAVDSDLTLRVFDFKELS